MITISKETTVAAVPLIAAVQRVSVATGCQPHPHLVGLQLQTSLDDSKAG